MKMSDYVEFYTWYKLIPDQLPAVELHSTLLFDVINFNFNHLQPLVMSNLKFDQLKLAQLNNSTTNCQEQIRVAQPKPGKPPWLHKWRRERKPGQRRRRGTEGCGHGSPG